MSARREAAIAEALTAHLVARGDHVASAVGNVNVTAEGDRAVVRMGADTYEVTITVRRTSR